MHTQDKLGNEIHDECCWNNKYQIPKLVQHIWKAAVIKFRIKKTLKYNQLFIIKSSIKKKLINSSFLAINYHDLSGPVLFYSRKAASVSCGKFVSNNLVLKRITSLMHFAYYYNFKRN